MDTGDEDWGKVKARVEFNRLRRNLLEAQAKLRAAGTAAAREAACMKVGDAKSELAWVLLDCERHERGLALLKSLSWRTHGIDKYNGMSRALSGMGCHDEARRLLERGVRRFPGSYALWIAMSAMKDAAGDAAGALRCVEKALECGTEDDSAALFNKAVILNRLGLHGEALEIMDRLIERHPDEAGYHVRRGAYCLDMGEAAGALGSYEKALELWRESPDPSVGVKIYLGLYCAYQGLGLRNEALGVALEGMRRFPDGDPGFYINLGNAFREMGWPGETREVLKEGVRRFPEDGELRQFLQDVEEDLDDPDDDGKAPFIGLLLLLSVLKNRWKKGRRG